MDKLMKNFVKEISRKGYRMHTVWRDIYKVVDKNVHDNFIYIKLRLVDKKLVSEYLHQQSIIDIRSIIETAIEKINIQNNNIDIIEKFINTLLVNFRFIKEDNGDGSRYTVTTIEGIPILECMIDIDENTGFIKISNKKYVDKESAVSKMFDYSVLNFNLSIYERDSKNQDEINKFIKFINEETCFFISKDDGDLFYTLQYNIDNKSYSAFINIIYNKEKDEIEVDITKVNMKYIDVFKYIVHAYNLKNTKYNNKEMELDEKISIINSKITIIENTVNRILDILINIAK